MAHTFTGLPPQHATFLMAMKVTELKDELEARGEAKTGAKAWLRRRLHAAILRTHLESSVAED